MNITEEQSLEKPLGTIIRKASLNSQMIITEGQSLEKPFYTPK